MNHLNLVAMIFASVGVAVCIAMNRWSSRLHRDAMALLAEVRRNHATSDAWVAEEREACALLCDQFAGILDASRTPETAKCGHAVRLTADLIRHRGEE